MKSSFFDVAVLGADPAAVAGAALVAKRGFRVLLLGQEDAPPTYEVDGSTLPRAPAYLPVGRVPAVERVVRELALLQVFHRRAQTPEPAAQLVVPGFRLAVGAGELLGRELEREFPAERRPIEAFDRAAHETAAWFDRWTARDLVWPPTGFLERREHARARGMAPVEDDADPLGELPARHPFRAMLEATARFGTGLDPEQRTGRSTLRLWSSWVSRTVGLPHGWGDLRRLLLERLETYGGEVRLADRARRIRLHRGAAEGIEIAGSGEEIGAGVVVCGVDLGRALRLLEDRSPFEEALERLGEPQPRHFRYTLNVRLAAEGVPEGMGRHVFFVRDAERPLQGPNALRVARTGTEGGEELLTVEALLPRRDVEEQPGYVAGAREAILGSLGELVPFLGKHVTLVDSPHDGRDPSRPREGATMPAPDPWTRGPSTMEVVYAYPVRTLNGLAAFPVQTPVRNLLLCNGQIVPGLGEEGRWLAAWAMARHVTRRDRRRARMRRGTWTRVEL